jgi:hypothetical protein
MAGDSRLHVSFRSPLWRSARSPREGGRAGAAAAFEQNVRRMYEQMARIAITPTWVRFYDFGAGRMPRFLQDLAEQSRMSAADWAD